MLAAGGMRQSLKPDTIRKKPTTTRNANGNSQDFCGIWDPVTFSTNVETVWVSYCRCRALYDSTVLRPVLMVTEYTSEKSAHALSELENVKKPTVMGTKYASKKVEVNRVYF